MVWNGSLVIFVSSLSLFSSKHSPKSSSFLFSSVFMFCYLSSPVWMGLPKSKGLVELARCCLLQVWKWCLVQEDTLEIVSGEWMYLWTCYMALCFLIVKTKRGIWEEDAYQCFTGKKAFENKHLILSDCYCTGVCSVGTGWCNGQGLTHSSSKLENTSVPAMKGIVIK